jgi:hypothetical protein
LYTLQGRFEGRFPVDEKIPLSSAVRAISLQKGLTGNGPHIAAMKNTTGTTTQPIIIP